MIINLKKNIFLDYMFRILCNFAFVDGIFVLYLRHKGLVLWQIGVLEGIFHATSLITEIPSGALADLLGRKQALLASRLFGVISSVIMLSTDRMWLLGIGFVFTAWSFNLLSGSEEALLYDSFLGLGQEEKYFKTNGRLSFAAEVSNGLGIFLGGFLAEYSYSLCYLILIGIDMLSFMVCLFLTEPKPGNSSKKEEISVKTHFIRSFHLLKENGKLRYILFHYAVLFAFFTSIYFYSQEYYFSRGFDEGEIGLILLGISGCSSIGALLSERITKKLGNRTCYVMGMILALGMSVMSAEENWVSVLGFGISSMANASLYPLQSSELNRRIPSAQRATVLSVSSMCFSVVMILVFPMIGLLADYLGLEMLIFILGVILLIYNYFHR